MEQGDTNRTAIPRGDNELALLPEILHVEQLVLSSAVKMLVSTSTVLSVVDRGRSGLWPYIISNIYDYRDVLEEEIVSGEYE